MEYRGPTTGDLANVHALNRSFLHAVSVSRGDRFRAIGAHRMTRTEKMRLASAPFLLFSLREQEDEYWQRLLSKEAQLELIDTEDCLDENFRQLQVASIGFLWQLAHRNAYVARLVGGASTCFCERMVQVTLVDLLHRVAERGDLMRMRLQTEENVWRRLLGSGTSPSYQARLASQHSALQVMLTQRNERQDDRMSAAACTLRAPVFETTARHPQVRQETKV